MATPSRPNVLFLLLDCLRADYLDGRSRRVRAPNLLRLTRGGLHCTEMIAAATTTTPCVASIMTGLYSLRHGIRSLRGYQLRSGLPTLPGLLRAAGYHTHAAVTGPLLPAVGLDRDFDSYEYREQDAYLDTAWGQALLARLTGGLPEPWFAFVHLWELHLPRRVGPEFRSRRFGRRPYERALSSLDARLGPLLSRLEGTTLIAIHGDHGELFPVPRLLKRFYRWQRKAFGRPFPPWPSFAVREGHGFDVWEDLVRVPFVLHLPARLPGRRLDALTRQVDVAPTLLELLGVPVPPDLDGVSLLPAALDGRALDLTAYVEACGATIVDPRDWRRGIRTARWKYIATEGGRHPEQLYDLSRDPRERRNLADREPAVTARLREDLARRIAAAGVLAPGESLLTGAEEALVEAKLRDLGYVE